MHRSIQNTLTLVFTHHLFCAYLTLQCSEIRTLEGLFFDSFMTLSDLQIAFWQAGAMKHLSNL